MMSQANGPNTPGIYVVIGGTTPGIQNTCPFVRSGKRAPSWPIVFKQNSIEAANILFLAQGIIEEAGVFEMTQLEGAAWIMNSLAIREISKKRQVADPYYALVSGKGSSMVFLSCDEVIDKVHGYNFASWRRLENFQEALGWMVLRGNHYEKFRWSRNPLTFNASVGNDYQVYSEPVTKSRSKKREQVSHQFNSTTQPASSSSASNLKYYKSSERNPGRLHTQGVRNTLDISEAPTTQKIWTHSRTLGGIVNTHLSRPPLDSTQELPPNFSTAANWYFTAHGYTSSTLWVIYNMWSSNNNDESGFADALWNAGIPYTEAEFIASAVFMDD